MNRYTVLGLVVGLAVGLLLGYQWGQAGRITAPEGGTASVPPMPGMPGGMPGMPPGGMPPPGGNPAADLNAINQIATLEKVVAQQPQNRDAWVQLGNTYFDTHQEQKAIEAYDRALQLRPDDPDVMTDQGVMYRNLGVARGDQALLDHALANFKKAHQLAPNHLDSLFNQGVVYLDKGNKAEARRIWNEVIQVAPTSSQAGRARQLLAQAQ